MEEEKKESSKVDKLSEELDEIAQKISSETEDSVDLGDNDLEKKIEEYEKKLLEQTEEIKNLNDRILRTMADSENAKKRMEKQLEDNAKYSISKFAGDLLPVIDNLGRATTYLTEDKIKQNDDLKSLSDGVNMTLNDFIKLFDKHKIETIEPKLGDKFDHNLHQAVSQIDHEEYESGVIINIMQKGYKIHERLLRPAMVSVAK